MADEKNLEQSSPETVNTEQTDNQTTKTPKLEDVMKRLEALESDNKRLQGSISAKDKTLNALKAEKEKIELEHMDEKERAEAALRKDREVLLSETKKVITDTIGIDEETARLLDGDSAELIKERAELLKNYKQSVLTEASKKIEELEKQVEILKGNMPNPGKGNSVSDLSSLSDTELHRMAKDNPTQKAAILAEIRNRAIPK